MKLCCVQLFDAAQLADALSIRRARASHWHAMRSIDFQIFRGAGLRDTLLFLARQATAATAGCEAILSARAWGIVDGRERANQSGRLAEGYADPRPL
jgi:hypothetical protein